MAHLLRVGLATALVAIDVARTIAAARSWWNSRLAAWHKWFTLNNAAELNSTVAGHSCLHQRIDCERAKFAARSLNDSNSRCNSLLSRRCRLHRRANASYVDKN